MGIHPVGVLIAQIKQLQGRSIERLLKRRQGLEGLNAAQLNILYQLWLEDDINISELSRRTKLANTTLTTMLERLEKQGQLRRIQNAENRREIHVCLTAKSGDMQADYQELIETMQQVNFAGFAPTEEAALRDYLERMRHNLEKFAKELEQTDGNPFNASR
ncbi:MAG: MarR family transcriptional regulator [Clostridia bacterium]